jgi:TRAP-type C4-dicarboxylate transport system permease small subunit
MDLSPAASEEPTMEHDISDILLISISLCFIIGGSIFAAMVVGMEYGVLEIPYGPYILLVIAVVIVVLAGLIVITGTEREKET